MRKLKLEEAIESAFSFRGPGSFETRDAAALAGGETITAKPVASGHVLRELFVFVPGTFLLFYSTLAAIFFYPATGISFLTTLLFFAGAFLTYAGSGNLKNTRNLVVPGSIMAFAAAVAAVSSLFPAKAQPDLYFWYSVYLFPNALIAAKLIRTCLPDKK